MKVYKMNVRLSVIRTDGSKQENLFSLTADSELGSRALASVFVQGLQVNENDEEVKLIIHKEVIDYEQKNEVFN